MKILIGIVFSLVASNVFAYDELIGRYGACRVMNTASLELADRLESELTLAQDETAVKVVLARIEDRRSLLEDLCRGLALEAKERLSDLQTEIEVVYL